MGKRKASPARPRHPINGETLRSAVEWAIEEKIFANVKFHGNVTWQAVHLILLAVIWVWSGHTTLTGAFEEARRWSVQVLNQVAVGTFQGMIKALTRWTASLLPPIRERLHALMHAHGGKHWRVERWLALAVDGSRISVPRTQENERAFCAPNYGTSYTAREERR